MAQEKTSEEMKMPLRFKLFFLTNKKCLGIFATAERPHGNNLIGTDRPDRRHFILSSIAVAGHRRGRVRPHTAWETSKTWCPSPDEDRQPSWRSSMTIILRNRHGSHNDTFQKRDGRDRQPVRPPSPEASGTM